MTFQVADRVQETSTTTGTGTLTLGGAVTGYRAFSSVCSNADTVEYAIFLPSDGSWEIGKGTYNSGTLSRDTVYSSSNSGSLVNFAAGTKYVWLNMGANQLSLIAAAQSVNTVLAGPSSGAAAVPTMRSLVDADVPDILTITKIANLTTNGFVKTGSGDGTLSVDTNTYLTSNQTITLSGDVSGSGATAITATLATVNASPGTYAIATVVVNGKGLVTSASAAGTTGSGNVVLAGSPAITTPTIASFANANHNHQNSAGGGTLDAASIASGVLANARVNFAAPAAIGNTTAASGAFTTLAAAATTITGTSDTPQLSVIGNGTQTSVLQQWENSTPAVVASVSNLGHVAFGQSAAPVSSTVIATAKSFADPANPTIGFDDNITTTYTATNTNSVFGVRGIITITQTGFNVTPTTPGNLAGIRGTTTISGSSNTVSGASALSGIIQNSGAGTLTAGAGLYIQNARNTGGGTFTTAYGVYIEGQTAAGTNYAIFTNAGKVQFGDSVTVAAGYLTGTMDTMTYASTISLDVTLGNLHKTTTVNSTGNATINASAAGVAGQHIWVMITNDGTSGKTITFGTNFKPSATVVGTTSKTAVVHFVSDGTNFYEVARTLGL